MKKLISARQVLLSFTIIALAAATSLAQNRERFGISAKAGGVNAVVGHVMVSRKDQQPQLLTNSDDLVAGDVVTTGASANIEVLLNPGSYFRLGENSEFQFQNTALDNLQIKLIKGTAILEVTGGEDLKLQMEIATPKDSFTILRGGIYRITVQSDSAEMAVHKGRASFSNTREGLVKGGKKVTLTNGVAAIAKIEKNKDGLDLWSKQRAELLARANEKLSSRQLNGYLSTFRDSGFAWNWPPWGIWTFSPRLGCFTFLPFFYGWSSPYGHYYGSYFDVYYWRGGRWGNGTFSPGPGGTIVDTRQSPGPGGTNPGGGAPAPSFNPPVTPASNRMEGDNGGRVVNKSREP